MGGCATKPKVLKDDAGKDANAPAPEPELVKEETPNRVIEAKRDIVDVNVEQSEKKGDKVKEIVDGDDKVDEQGSKHRSLTELFKEFAGPPFVWILFLLDIHLLLMAKEELFCCGPFEASPVFLQKK